MTLARLKNALATATRSVFRVGWPKSDRTRVAAMVSSLLLHLHPARVMRHSLRFVTTFGLGLVSFYLFVVLVVTGLLLMLYYSPHPSEAYRSMKDLEFAVAFGRPLRNLHRWAAHAMVATVFLHMCRVFFTAAYKPPRQFNWIVGVLLLLSTLALSFTGYLLPWDQLAYWAITVGTSIVAYAPVVGERLRFLLLGGHTIGGTALLRFYVLHCVILPLALALLVSLHFWRVRKDGGLARPAHVRHRLVLAWPHLLARELALLLITLLTLSLVSLLCNAPLDQLANPALTPNPAKAPWYFLGLQELVKYGAVFGGVVVPGAALLALLLLPYVDAAPRGVGIYFARERWLANALFASAVVAAVVFTVIGTFFRGPNWAWVWPFSG